MTDTDNEKKLSELQKLPKLIEALNSSSLEIQKLTSENRKILNLKVPIEIYTSNPKVFRDAYDKLSETEKTSLLSLSNITPNSSTASILSSMNNILNNIPDESPPEYLQSGLQTLLNNNLSQMEITQSNYDDLNIKVKQLLETNPLDLIPFGEVGTIARLFSVSANSMMKFVSKFMINSFKETSRPKLSTRKGSIDFSKTIRTSMKYEGTPYELKRRSKAVKIRQVQPKIYFILDTSGSQEQGIYLSVALVYAIISVLKEYDVIIYTGSSHSHYSETYKLLEDAERRNLTEQRILQTTQRFNKQTILKYLNNPNKLYSLITDIRESDSDDTYFIMKSISSIIPDNSLIITLGDNHQLRLSPRSNAEFNKTIPQKNIKTMKQKLKGKVYSFNTDSIWSRYYNDNTYIQFNFVPFSPQNFNVEDIIFYPMFRKPNFTYGDWVRELIKVISGFREKNL